MGRSRSPSQTGSGSRSNLKLATINHYMPPDSKIIDCLSGNVAGRTSARSHHGGGVNVRYADGHVQFVKNSVNPLFWRSITTRAGGEIVSADAF